MSVEKKKGSWFFLKSRLRRPHRIGDRLEDYPGLEKLYRKADDYMSRAKPFLCESFSLSDFAEGVYTNKTYLSRSINMGAHKGFRVYLNGYRVEHACALMNENPRLTVKEVALKSGFKNSVSFNDAFKKAKGMTPGTYLKNIKEEKGRSLSNSPEEDRQSSGPSSSQDGRN